MFILKAFFLPLFGVITLIFGVATALAGGGLVMLEATPSIPGIRLHPGEFYTVRATVYTDNSYTTRCNECPIVFKFQNSDSTDVVTHNMPTTDTNGQASAKMVSNILGDRLVYAEVELPDGTNYTSSSYVLSYNQSPTPDYVAPVMVYPQDQQVLDLEGAYMFKVKQVSGATGYLFGLFQDGVMVYENYRDEKTLSANGEFALWESHRAHVKFKNGPVKVMVRALVNNKWTDAREITIYLKPRGGSEEVVTTIVDNSPESPAVKAKLPVIQPSKTVVIVHDSSASAELQKKVEELEQKLVESQDKQTALENRLDQLINWIKSIFPFFD